MVHTTPATPPPRPRTPRLRWLRRSLFVLLYAAILAVALFAGLVTAALRVLPQLEQSAQKQQAVGAIYARDGKTVLRKLKAQTSHRYASQQQIPAVLAHAVVAAEDHRFYEHAGVDLRGTTRALLHDLRHRDFSEGGSTLTQQLVKNTYVGPEKTIGRKSREALLAIVLDASWSKQKILTTYLNNAYFGDGAYGIVDAADRYFGVPVAKLSAAQSALLAGLLHDPGINPATDVAQTTARRNEVLGEMRALGYLSDANVAKATAVAVKRAPAPKAANELAPHFDDAVVAQLIDQYGVAQTLGGGLRVTTTLDMQLQLAAHTAVQQIAGTGLSAALVAVDPRDGQVRALILGGPAADNAFDVATDGQRQAGSAFKPFTLAAAYASGLTPDSKVLSAPFDEVWGGKRVKISNDEDSYANALVSVSYATWHSDNSAFARLAKQVGIPKVVAAAHAAGIVSPLDNLPSTALGGLTRGVSPLEMASAYATFDHHGTRVTGPDGLPILMTKVNEHGKVIAKPRATSRHEIDPQVADLVTSTLEGVIEHGTGTRANIGRPAAGKTGTTSHNVDAWFVGYTPDLVTAVWVGNPSGAVPMTNEFHGEPVQGGTFPAQIWAAFMRQSPPSGDFSLNTPRYVTVRIDPENGLLAGPWCVRGVSKRVLAGHAPTVTSTDCPDAERAIPSLIGMTQAAATTLLDADGFTYDVDQTPADTPSDVGIVTDQIPDPGTKIARTDSITLLVGTRL